MSEKKVFVFKRDDSLQTHMIHWPVPNGLQTMNLQNIIDSVPDLDKSNLKIFDSQTNLYVSLHTLCRDQYEIPVTYLDLQYILFEYTAQQMNDDQESPNSDDNKKERSKERTVGEVIELVHRWRDLHNSTAPKKMNLQEAAREVGVSKKSLDDYYYQLRTGQKYDFDFAKHFQDKIGVLRGFIKENEPQGRGSKDKNIKHSKKLKIIQEFEKKLQIRDAPVKKEEEIEVERRSEELLMENMELSNASGPMFYGTPYNVDLGMVDNYEDNFFKEIIGSDNSYLDLGNISNNSNSNDQAFYGLF